jgi:hypothetical protein
MCSKLVKRFSSELSHTAIGRLSITRVEQVSGSIYDEASSSSRVTICNDVPSNLERLAADFEGALAALQEAPSASGVPIAGPMLEVWNGSDNNDDDSAKLRVTAIHKFALRQLASQFRRSLATAKKEAEDKEAAAQVQESDEDMEMEM